MTKPASVDAYIEAAAPAARRILRTIRATARKHAPGAQELLRYRIPALKSNGILLYYAAFKDHIGIFPPSVEMNAWNVPSLHFGGRRATFVLHLTGPFLTRCSRASCACA